MKEAPSPLRAAAPHRRSHNKRFVEPPEISRESREKSQTAAMFKYINKKKMRMGSSCVETRRLSSNTAGSFRMARWIWMERENGGIDSAGLQCLARFKLSIQSFPNGIFFRDAGGEGSFCQWQDHKLWFVLQCVTFVFIITLSAFSRLSDWELKGPNKDN